jgi:preprotein translocase subunit YajC
MQMQSALAPGARVMTTSGMYADVVSVDDDGLVLEIAPGVEARFVKQAVMQVVTEGDKPAEEIDLTEDDDEDLGEETAKTDLTKDGKGEDGAAGGATAADADEAADEDEDGKPAAQGAGAGKGLKKSSG